MWCRNSSSKQWKSCYLRVMYWKSCQHFCDPMWLCCCWSENPTRGDAQLSEDDAPTIGQNARFLSVSHNIFIKYQPSFIHESNKCTTQTSWKTLQRFMEGMKDRCILYVEDCFREWSWNERKSSHNQQKRMLVLICFPGPKWLSQSTHMWSQAVIKSVQFCDRTLDSTTLDQSMSNSLAR